MFVRNNFSMYRLNIFFNIPYLQYIVVYHYQLDKIDKIKHEQCYITYMIR